jgi:superfamily I DNA/RNA helicase
LIIVDEFQDTSAEQWELLQRIGRSSQVVAFGDPNQIIYESLHQAQNSVNGKERFCNSLKKQRIFLRAVYII